MYESIRIRPRTIGDDAAIVAIRNEAHPWLPPTSVEEYRWHADPANSPPGEINERWVADLEGKVLGLCVLGQLSFFQRPNTFGANVGVGLRHRRQRVGGRLYDHLMDRATLHAATRLYANVSEDDEEGMGFAERRGFARSGRIGRLSRLEVDKANLRGYENVASEVESGGITIKTLAEKGIGDLGMLKRIHQAWKESAQDVPSSERLGDFPFETWVKWLDAPGNAPDQTWIAFDGDTPVGLAQLGRRGCDAAFNNYTGVVREYRGRGIARALKLETIEFARARGIQHIFTANDTENKVMLSINIPLGYEAVPSELELVKDLPEGS